METLASALQSSLFQAQASAGAHYQKQFVPLSGDVLWNVLGFIGACVALAALAGWLLHGESQDAKRRKNPSKEQSKQARKPRKADPKRKAAS